jgi:hypothetical protein
MYLRTPRRRNQDGSIVEYYQLAETRWDPVKRRPTAHIIHNFGRADTLDREALVRLAPVYHWTAHRIASHVKLCVLALLLQRAAEIRTGDPWRNLHRLLDEVKAVRYRVQATTLVQSTRLTPHAAAMLKQLQMPPPKRLLAVER